MNLLLYFKIVVFVAVSPPQTVTTASIAQQFVLSRQNCHQKLKYLESQGVLKSVWLNGTKYYQLQILITGLPHS